MTVLKYIYFAYISSELIQRFSITNISSTAFELHPDNCVLLENHVISVMSHVWVQ